ncbi:RodZ domain-containing protein [Kistimonas asteriae]|uniref:RodZ domain-containing protein n=1 Tax=Kistimonas asteriae TaxID=517724 RepID=UPI001BA88C59|nr:helix-turn-helix domain-containing protein [Kistimonas asteriae]
MTNSDNNNREPSDSPVIETEDVRESLGDLLRQSREGKGLDVREAAEALKISVDFVRALESGHYEVLPGETFIKGYLKGYARLLGLDEEDVLARFSMDGVSRGEIGKKSAYDAVSHRHNRRGRIMFTALSLVLLGVVAGGIYWWQGNQAGDIQIPVAESESAPVPTPEQELFPSEDSPAVGETSGQDSAPAMLEAEPAVVETASDDDVVEVAQPEPSVLIASAPEQAKKVADEEVVASDDHRLVIRFRADCWVQVKGADNKVLFADLKRADSELDMRAEKGPVSILFGDVSAVQSVYFNGKPVTLDKPVSGKKVGRLKLG